MIPAFVPVLAAAACAAAACDLRARRIPNVLTGTLAIAGVAVAGATRGLPGLGVALATLAVVLALGTSRSRAAGSAGAT